jgi:phosphate transport system permease protein
VLPYARSGIVSATLLGLGRALGETMAIALIISPSIQFSLRILTEGQNSQTIAANIALNFQVADGPQRAALIGTGLVLFIITLAVNIVARFIVSRTGKSGGGARRVQLAPPEAASLLVANDPTLSPVRGTNDKAEGASA